MHIKLEGCLTWNRNYQIWEDCLSKLPQTQNVPCGIFPVKSSNPIPIFIRVQSKKKEAINTLPSKWVKTNMRTNERGMSQNSTDQGMPTRKRNNVLITEAHVGDKYISQMVRTWNFKERIRNFSQEITGLIYNRNFHSNEFFSQCKWW